EPGCSMHKLAQFVPAAILLGGCVLLARSRAQRAMPLRAPIANVLAAYPGYTVQRSEISADERRVAGMTDYVARSYLVDTTLAFTTLVSYYDRQAQGRTIHSPRNSCPARAGRLCDRVPPTFKRRPARRS